MKKTSRSEDKVAAVARGRVKTMRRNLLIREFASYTSCGPCYCRDGEKCLPCRAAEFLKRSDEDLLRRLRGQGLEESAQDLEKFISSSRDVSRKFREGFRCDV